jgi:choloylglycine hydrolase
LRSGAGATETTYIPESCTIFTAAIGDTVFFGNNEDYLLYGTYLWLTPSQEITTPGGTWEINGAAFFGFDNNSDSADGYPQGGINIHGLCVDGNGLPGVSLNPYPGRDRFYGPLMAAVLWECSTVEEVITWFQTHYLGSYWSGQLPFADATGDAVVVSVGTDGEFAFTRIETANYLVSTNFNLVDHDNGWYPCWRYETATNMLGDITVEQDLTMEACRDVLDAVHQEGTYATKYSNVFDLITRTIYIWEPERRGFDEMVTLDLYEELARVVPGAPGVATEPDYTSWG